MTLRRVHENDVSGFMYQIDNAIQTTIPVINTWVRIDNFLPGRLNNASFADNQLTVEEDGIYQIMWHTNLFDANNFDYEITLEINGVADERAKGCVFIKNIIPIFTLSGNMQLDLFDGDTVGLVIKNTSGTSPPTIVNAQVSLFRIIRI